MDKIAKKIAGFSLFEMIIVMVIIAIIYTFAAPNLSRYNTLKKLEHEAEKIVNVLKIVQSNSLTQDSEYKLVIDKAAKEYYYMLNSEEGKSYHRDKIYHLDPGIAILAAPLYIAFNTNGGISYPKDESIVTIILKSNIQKEIHITINKRTGKINLDKK